jgi:polyhydroxyalkanoate synthesis regulator phasin
MEVTMKIKLLSPFFILLFITPTFATDYLIEQKDEEYKNIESMVGAIHLEKKQVESMLDKMVQSGRMSPEEGNKVKREIASVKDNDLEEFKARALVEVKSNKIFDH